MYVIMFIFFRYAQSEYIRMVLLLVRFLACSLSCRKLGQRLGAFEIITKFNFLTLIK